MKKWEIISSKEVFKHPRLTLVEDEVLLPNGLKLNYLKYKDSKDAVTVIAKRADGKILLSKEYSHPPQKMLFQFPGGGILKNEKPEKGAIRELAEETNYRAGELMPLGSYLIDNRRSTARMFAFLADDLKFKKTEGDAQEDIKNFWFSEDEINKMIKQGEIINCHVLAAWSLYNLLDSFHP